MDWLWIILGILLVIVIYFALQLRRAPDRKTSEAGAEIKIDAGLLSQYMATNQAQTEAVYENAYVLIADQTLQDINDLVPLLEKVLLKKRPLLVIAQAIEDEVLSTLAVNRVKGQLQSVAVQAPEGDQFRQIFLEDIASKTGGQVIEKASSLKKANLSQLGQISRVKVTQDTTYIIS